MGDPAPEREPKKLILCFDGTGNTFSGSNADTNVVKILNRLDRNDPRQYHYYQTGVDTYDINEKSVNKTWLGSIQSSISQTIDQGIGTTFDAHVMAGYRFLMRYHDSGDKIYMFGFSRGAFTAKLLTRMINAVGLLCKGNEEMVPFAYRLYQKYLASGKKDYKYSHPRHSATFQGEHISRETEQLPGDKECDRHSEEYYAAFNEIKAFKAHFCRQDMRSLPNGVVQQTEITVYFLGIWDCVNSVAILEQTGFLPVPVTGTARYVRHAVAVDERRVKFKAALLAQDITTIENNGEDIKEVWFPGTYGDVGGGWPAVPENAFDTHQPMSVWQRIKHFWMTRHSEGATKNVREDLFQMSDIPLAWMIRELELIGKRDGLAGVKWSKNVEGFKNNFRERGGLEALKGNMHDSLSFGCGTGFFKVLL
ncbi:hypothetical protein BKA67DRAFT_655097 [Truncatella angustata]|uniref:T6SS Phospholipase effector Tle1-like catalytic domain-containing protein n=1 Tax=Truncatella angustata TaxID=152316 RepID=A0A9P8UR19_9PEZI|nr:uncharacterized protein BKA67DRAFT_655097 [Truncatella angustata]KAH6656788.1 hypothetical protein BKA67DRAFT_655097 [Truncatella angustata]KAH8197889.1 hypothetical protein TruAng_007941 [Truncatella angustata]